MPERSTSNTSDGTPAARVTGTRATGRDSALIAITHGLERFTNRVGWVAAFLAVATVVICFATVYLRYAIGLGLVWLQEAYIWTHAAAIMIGASFSMLRGGFVRVDIFYARMTARGRALVDVAGTLLFTLPFLAVTAWYSWSFFLSSWRMGEISQQHTGLPALYILKGTLLVFAVLVALQGLAMLARSVLVLRGHDAPPYGGH
jgi:TRAP-type mannitol/chloroaromatic compound transport system permease small subunit